MNYPVWELGFGPGLLIAIVAILHVFVSHFAIGGGFFLTLTEYYAVRKKDNNLLDYLYKHSRFFALVTLVFGAMTGVGIWFTIGLINPSATSMLIHNFVWIWATEWIFFLVEVAAAIVFYTTWKRVSQKTHFIVGWIYFISAFWSLVLINGILTFMLTPEKWLNSGNVFEGFFNPTFLPSFFTRLAICTGLAGIYALVTAPFIKDKVTRIRLIRYAGLWALLGILLAVPSLLMYYNLLPLDVNELFSGRLPTSLTSVNVLFVCGSVLFLFTLIPVLIPRYFKLGIALVMLVLALLSFGASEFIRESVRKPWAIYSYMYGSGIRPTEYEQIEKKGGILSSSIYVKNQETEVSSEAGEDVFRIACRSCHSLNGYKGLRIVMTGLNKEFIVDVINRLEHLRGKMPPFPGTGSEAEALAEYLMEHTDTSKKIISGEEVFRKRCNICHTVKKEYRGLYSLLKKYSFEELLEKISSLGTYQKKMAPWSGTEEEKRKLAEFIISWYETGGGGKD